MEKQYVVAVKNLSVAKVTRLVSGEERRRIAEEEDLGYLFWHHGCKIASDVDSVSLMVDPSSSKCRGFGFVKFEDEDSLNKALQLNGLKEEDLTFSYGRNSGKTGKIALRYREAGIKVERKQHSSQERQEQHVRHQDVREEENLAMLLKERNLKVAQNEIMKKNLEQEQHRLERRRRGKGDEESVDEERSRKRSELEDEILQLTVAQQELARQTAALINERVDEDVEFVQQPVREIEHQEVEYTKDGQVHFGTPVPMMTAISRARTYPSADEYEIKPDHVLDRTLPSGCIPHWRQPSDIPADVHWSDSMPAPLFGPDLTSDLVCGGIFEQKPELERHESTASSSSAGVPGNVILVKNLPGVGTPEFIQSRLDFALKDVWSNGWKIKEPLVIDDIEIVVDDMKRGLPSSRALVVFESADQAHKFINPPRVDHYSIYKHISVSGHILALSWPKRPVTSLSRAASIVASPKPVAEQARTDRPVEDEDEHQEKLAEGAVECEPYSRGTTPKNVNGDDDWSAPAPQGNEAIEKNEENADEKVDEKADEGGGAQGQQAESNAPQSWAARFRNSLGSDAGNGSAGRGSSGAAGKGKNVGKGGVSGAGKTAEKGVGKNPKGDGKNV